MLLRNAAKARLMRWVKPKTKRVDREAPEVVKAEWGKGNRNALADLFSQVNFQEDRHNIFVFQFLVMNTHTSLDL